MEGPQGPGNPEGGVSVWVAGREREHGAGRWASGMAGSSGVCGYDDQWAGGYDEYAREGDGLGGVGRVGGEEEGREEEEWM